MPSTTFKKRDLNRYKKTYAFVRRTPRWALLSEKATIIEVADVRFDNESSKRYIFREKYSSVPVVTATSAGSNADVNVNVVAVTTQYVDLETSQALLDTVQVHIIWIES